MAVTVEPLAEALLPDAERVFRLAFGRFLGIPDPEQFTGDCAYTRTRWLADPGAAWAAIDDGELVGCNFAARWGSFAFFGPLSVRPDRWERGIARRLLDVTMRRFEEWGVSHAGLYTFAESPKHVALYQRYGFLPHYLTAIGGKPVAAGAGVAPAECRSALPVTEREAVLAECAALTDAILAGLDVGREIDAVQAQALGDTLLLREAGVLRGFAVCHVGAGTEAGSGVCYVKFAAVESGPGAAERFARLLDLCERLAAQRGAVQLVAGINTGRAPAYRAWLAHGFRPYAQGVAMQRPDAPGFNRPDAWVVDDWR
jgi:GNAT superfamily N-acetyltransferase